MGNKFINSRLIPLIVSPKSLYLSVRCNVTSITIEIFHFHSEIHGRNNYSVILEIIGERRKWNVGPPYL